ncbi:hypothetical protein V5O48_005563 [Marasmius crinis-equi]|uniref:Haloacid dehalogenase n=1 Tax=Marasmius crinis-equi TaxID=585013 RepID=A0ABR3FLZ5_9AGAR
MSGNKPQIKAVLFDFMGTCLYWHTTIVQVLPKELTEDQKSHFALNWRQTYFDTNAARIRNNQPPEDIDETHRRTLDVMLDQHPDFKPFFTDAIRQEAIAAWHRQKAWSDVPEALRKIREELGLEAFVHANGTTRLQLDLVKYSGLQYDMLFSSQLLGCYKPAPESYEKVLVMLKLKPEDCVMVAAHEYDLRGAREAGMKTVYIRRWTDDIHEDQGAIREANDVYLEDMQGLHQAILELQG